MITTDHLRRCRLFAALPAADLERIAARVAEVHLQDGEWLIREGQPASFFSLLDGELAVLKAVAGRDERINGYVPGDSFGELPLLLGSAAVASLRAVGPCRVMRLAPPDFHELVVRSDALSAAVLRQMSERVNHLQQVGSEAPLAGTVVVGRHRDAACHGLRDFLARNGEAFQWWDPSEPDGADALRRAGVVARELPVVLLEDGRQLARPSVAELADAIGLRTRPERSGYDVVVVGGGPAGLAAAVYGASEGLGTLLVERLATGGQAGTSSRIENYLGFPAGLSGDDLAGRARQQARRLGAELVVGRCVVSLTAADAPGKPHLLRLDDDTTVAAKTVVLATGVDWRRLDAPGVDALTGRGVFYGAARTEALSMRGRHVHLVGGGNSAGQAAVLFSEYADRVTLLVRGEDLGASMSDYLVRQLATKRTVEVVLGTQVVAARGRDTLQGLTLQDRSTGARRDVDSDGLFVFIGAVADTDWLDGVLRRDGRGFVCTGPRVSGPEWPLERDPLPLEASVPGVFAAGDVRADSVKRVASGVGEGSMAIALVHQYLAQRPRTAPSAPTVAS